MFMADFLNIPKLFAGNFSLTLEAYFGPDSEELKILAGRVWHSEVNLLKIIDKHNAESAPGQTRPLDRPGPSDTTLSDTTGYIKLIQIVSCVRESDAI
jgi:hypothetical protein